jgi:hypothetical protein
MSFRRHYNEVVRVPEAVAYRLILARS